MRKGAIVSSSPQLELKHKKILFFFKLIVCIIKMSCGGQNVIN